MTASVGGTGDSGGRPKRIQLRRTKGWRKPEGAIVVSRPSRWGNPFKVGDPSPFGEHGRMTRADAVEVYRYMLGDPTCTIDPADSWTAGSIGFLRIVRTELAGHDLACWCPLDQPCHADVLLEIANAGGSS